MPTGSLTTAHRLLAQAVDELSAVAVSGGRRRAGVAPDRVRGRGAAAGPGHGRRGGRAGAARHVRRARLQVDGRGAGRPTGLGTHPGRPAGSSAAEQIQDRASAWTGELLAPRLAATKRRCSQPGGTSLRHVEIIARELGGRPGRAAGSHPACGPPPRLRSGREGRPVLPGRVGRLRPHTDRPARPGRPR